jgi:hypothetical protein
MQAPIEDAIADIKDATELPATPKWHLCSAAGATLTMQAHIIVDGISHH